MEKTTTDLITGLWQHWFAEHGSQHGHNATLSRISYHEGFRTAIDQVVEICRKIEVVPLVMRERFADALKVLAGDAPVELAETEIGNPSAPIFKIDAAVDAILENWDAWDTKAGKDEDLNLWVERMRNKLREVIADVSEK